MPMVAEVTDQEIIFGNLNYKGLAMKVDLAYM